MFKSPFTQRLWAYLRSPKKYEVSTTIKVGPQSIFGTVQVEAYNKVEARYKAKQQLKETISVTSTGSKCLGRVSKYGF